MSDSDVFIEAELRPEFERATSIELVDSDEVLEPDPGSGKESSEPGPDPETGKEASEPEPTGKESSEADPQTETETGKEMSEPGPDPETGKEASEPEPVTEAADTGYVDRASDGDRNRPIM